MNESIVGFAYNHSFFPQGGVVFCEGVEELDFEEQNEQLPMPYC